MQTLILNSSPHIPLLHPIGSFSYNDIHIDRATFSFFLERLVAPMLHFRKEITNISSSIATYVFRLNYLDNEENPLLVKEICDDQR